MEYQFGKNILCPPDPQEEYYHNKSHKSSGFNILMKWALMAENKQAFQEMDNVLNCIGKYFPNIINSKNNNGLTILMISAMNSTTCSNNIIVKKIIEVGADVNIQDNEGKTALIHVIQNLDHHNINNELETIQLLLEGGANVNIQDNEKSTALTYAVSTKCCTKIINLLIDFGATSDNLNNSGLTPLMYCFLSNDYYDNNIFQVMIKASYNINVRSKDGINVLIYAIQTIKNNNLVNIVEYLVNANIDVNVQTEQGMSALLYLITECSQNEDMVKLFCPILQLLLNGGLYLDIPNQEDQTPLVYASMKTNPFILDIIKCLIYYGANIYSIDSNGMSALFYLITMNSEIAPEIIQISGMIGSNLNIINGIGVNLLTYACVNCPHNNIEKVVEALINSGVDVNLPDENGKTPLMESSENSRIKSTNKVIELLIKNGANINAQDKNGFTPLIYAVQSSNTTSTENTVKILLNSGANVNLTTYQHNSAVIFAIHNIGSNSSNQILKILVESGADVNMKNDNGYSAIYYAIDLYGKGCNEETIQILLDGGVNLDNSDKNLLSIVMDKYIDNKNFPINIVKMVISKCFNNLTEEEHNNILNSILINKNYFGSSFNDDDKCIICLESAVNYDNCVQLIFCSHKFHEQCIDKWLEKNKICPLCRTKIKF